MCGIVGWINTDEELSHNTHIIEPMLKTLTKRGPDAIGIHIYPHALLGHARLIVVDPEGGGQPMKKRRGNAEYTLIYNGELYNTEDVRKQLKEKGYLFDSYSDTEVLLTAYMEWKENCVHYINGIYAFAIWSEHQQCLFMARDPLGVKPLFYSRKGDDFYFASEIKALLKHPKINPVVKEEGLMEIFSLGPARSLGNAIFDEIKEVPPGHCVILKDSMFTMKEYWKLTAKPHEEDLKTTIEHTRSLFEDAVTRQLISDVPVCTFLSGGLDSSAISAIAANYYKENDKGILTTYSIDYEDNDQYFKKSIYQPNSDSHYVDLMSDFIGSQHKKVILNNHDLVTSLTDAVHANDLPGMADIDSSLYLFCKEVKQDATVALSGECADEIFGGYPWFTRKELQDLDTFPWAHSTDIRRQMLHHNLTNLPIEAYSQQKYWESIKQVPKLKNENVLEGRIRELFYLNLKWFMVTLLNRKDRMSMANSLEVRVPFADHRLVEYAYNIPSHIKLLEGREKGLLRKALEGLLPEEIIYRKKSPYPKTHHPVYTKAVHEQMKEILNDPKAPIRDLVNDQTLQQIMNGDDTFTNQPWYGQLMTGPQIIAYFIQINTWMKTYNITIK